MWLSLLQWAKAIAYDADGIDVHFLCDPRYMTKIQSLSTARELLSDVEPLGESTPTEIRIEELVGPYVELCENNKAAGTELPKAKNFIIMYDF